MTPFDYVNNICTSRENIWQGEMSDKEYQPFLVNRSLSQHVDTLFAAQEMNERWGSLTNHMQYDYLRTTIVNKRKRFAKWHKPEEDQTLLDIQKVYGVNVQVARGYLSLLNTENRAIVSESLNTGGRSGRK